MEWVYDKRVLERNIQKGLVSAKDVEKHLKNLPDLADQIHVPEESPEEEAQKEE